MYSYQESKMFFSFIKEARRFILEQGGLLWLAFNKPPYFGRIYVILGVPYGGIV